MSLAEARKYICDAATVPTVKLISFTGGEPFLFPDVLFDLVSHASRLRLNTECTTNCFWAKTEYFATKYLQRMVEAGLSVINISADDFHQEYIPFTRVRNCFRAAKSLGLKIVIMSVAAKSSRFRLKKIVSMLDDGNIRVLKETEPNSGLEASNVIAVETGFIPVGRASNLPRTELINRSPLFGSCSRILRHVAIDPSGRVFACCSAGALTQALDIGNAKGESLLRIIEDANRNSLIMTLAKGPQHLPENVEIEMMERSGYANKCHLCYEVLSNLEN